MSTEHQVAEASAEFADACIKTGRDFIVYRIRIKLDGKMALCMFMHDDHVLAAKLHDLTRAAISVAEAQGVIKHDGEDVRKTLIGGEPS